MVVGIWYFYKRFFCGRNQITRFHGETPSCPPQPSCPPPERINEPLKSVSNLNWEYETAPSSLKKDRKSSAPTLLFVKKPIPSYPTFVY